jgi:hypothetical protein
MRVERSRKTCNRKWVRSVFFVILSDWYHDRQRVSNLLFTFLFLTFTASTHCAGEGAGRRTKLKRREYTVPGTCTVCLKERTCSQNSFLNGFNNRYIVNQTTTDYDPITQGTTINCYFNTFYKLLPLCASSSYPTITFRLYWYSVSYAAIFPLLFNSL